MKSHMRHPQHLSSRARPADRRCVPAWPTFIGCALAWALLSGGCTTLGPMPGMTVANPLPQSRIGGEVQIAVVPGYYLSEATQQRVDAGGAMTQLGAWFEPGSLLEQAKGLGVGARFLSEGGGQIEPMLRYRTWLDDQERIALAGVFYGTQASAEASGADYRMMRGGAELVVDVRVTPKNRWAELHLSGGASLTALSATGHYCMNDKTGYGRDCDDGKPEPDMASVSFDGVLPSAFVGVSGDFFRGVPVLQGVRLGTWLAGGTMPRFEFGERAHDQSWFSWGLNLELGIGQW